MKTPLDKHRVPSPVPTKTPFAKADFVLRVLTLFAVVGGGVWAFYLYQEAGATNWTNNITLETKILPYHDNLRLLVVHVKTKNPRTYKFELDSKLGDSFELCFRKMATDAKENAVFEENQCEDDLIATADLLKGTGDGYVFLPGAEMDEMRTIVVPVNTTVALTAEMQIHTGTKDKHGKPDTDFVSTSTVVRIEP